MTEPVPGASNATASKVRQYSGFPSFSAWCKAAPSALPPNADLKNRSLAVPEKHLSEALQVVRRAAAVETGAIEDLYSLDRGFTMSIALGGATWEAAMAARSDAARPMIEAQLAAYERLVDLMNTDWSLNEAAIRDLHVEICKGQDDYIVHTAAGRQFQALPKGEFKKHPNNVLTIDQELFQYCPPDRVVEELRSLLAQVDSDEFRQASSLLQASWFHYAFILIHPFADGNGRMARLLGSLFLFKAASVPFLVFADEKGMYFRALRAADLGEYEPFISFTSECVANAFGLLETSAKAAALPSPSTSLNKLRRAYFSDAGVTYEEIETRVIGMLDHVESRLQASLLEIQAQSEGLIELRPIVRAEQLTAEPAEPRFRAPRGSSALLYSLTTKSPVVVEVRGGLQIEMPRNPALADKILVRCWQASPTNLQTILEVRIEQLMLEPISPRVEMDLTVGLEYITRRMLLALGAFANKARANM